MSPITFSILAFFGSVLAGLLGSMTGLGGGVVIIPLLVLGLGVDFPFAVGTSLVSVIATSSGSAAAYVREGYTNIRVAMILELATISGALLGALLTGLLDKSVVATIFSLVVFWSAYNSLRDPTPAPADERDDALATRLNLHSTYPTPGGFKRYTVHNVPGGFAVMLGAGVLSALTGVGAGIVKVFAMDRLMRLPFKVSTTTSNFMIGVTAAASAGVYFAQGKIDPVLTAPVALGALVGSLAGARLLARAKVRWLRLLFAVVVVASGVQILIRVYQGTI